MNEKIHMLLKGTVSRDFRLLVFFMNQFPPNPSNQKNFNYFVWTPSQPVSTTPGVPVAKFAPGVVETSGKYTNGVVDTGANLLPVLLTLAANLPPVSLKLVVHLVN